MVAYSFKSRFVEPILAGTKGGTIRAERKARGPSNRPGGHAYPGEALQIYTGMRTKQCRRITTRTCKAVEPISLRLNTEPWNVKAGIMLGGRWNRGFVPLTAFARFDGFQSWAEMVLFWAEIPEGEQFDGWHIRWDDLPEELRGT